MTYTPGKRVRTKHVEEFNELGLDRIAPNLVGSLPKKRGRPKVSYSITIIHYTTTFYQYQIHTYSLLNPSLDSSTETKTTQTTQTKSAKTFGNGNFRFLFIYFFLYICLFSIYSYSFIYFLGR